MVCECVCYTDAGKCSYVIDLVTWAMMVKRVDVMVRGWSNECEMRKLSGRGPIVGTYLGSMILNL